jgi:hypothetical protein
MFSNFDLSARAGCGGCDFRFSRKTANSRARFARVFYENIALAKAFLKKRLKTHFAFWLTA